MEENNSNDSACPLMARFYSTTLVSVYLARVYIFFADVYLLIATDLTWGIGFHNRGQMVNSFECSSQVS